MRPGVLSHLSWPKQFSDNCVLMFRSPPFVNTWALAYVWALWPLSVLNVSQIQRPNLCNWLGFSDSQCNLDVALQIGSDQF